MAQQDTSALFSLKELMRLEEERIVREERERKQLVEERERARVAAEEHARLRAAEEKRRHEEERQRRALQDREEQVRLEAIRAAELERARLDALERARLAQLSLDHEHQQRIARVAASAELRRWKAAPFILSAACVVLAVGPLVLYEMKIRPEQNRHTAELENMVRAERETAMQLRRELDEQNKRLKELADKCAILAAPTPVPAATASPPPKPTHETPKGTRSGNTRPPPPCTCDRHDPLCGCLEQ